MTDAQFERQGMRWREVGAQHQLVLIGISKIADALKPDADRVAERVPIPGGIAPDCFAIFRSYIDEIEHQRILLGEGGFQHQSGGEEILMMAVEAGVFMMVGFSMGGFIVVILALVFMMLLLMFLSRLLLLRSKLISRHERNFHREG